MESPDSDLENNNQNDQLSSQQRKLCYRDMLNRVEGLREQENLGLDAAKQIGEIIKQVNTIESEHNISERYRHPDETLLDHKLVRSVSDVLVKCAESVDVNGATYDPSEFADKIIDFVTGGEEFDDQCLLKLLDDVQRIVPSVPDYTFIYGTYDLENLPKPKEKKQRQKRQREKFQKKEPERVTNLEKEEKGIDEIVKVLYDILMECYGQNGEQPVKYYDYVIDTESFVNTVENIFYCSFLVRDGRAKLDLDGNGVPYLQPLKKRQLKEFRDEGGANSQVISVITIPEWETFKKAGYIQKSKKVLQNTA